MKVIVTGGAGFIGSHLAEKLTKINKITKVIVIDHLQDGSLKNLKKILKNKKLVVIKKDIRNFKNIEKNFKNVKCVFHLAGIADIVPSILNPIDYLNTNFSGTINILESMRKHNVKKIIFAASSSCYGLASKKAISEKASISTLYPYSFSKYVAEQAIIHWSKVYNLNFISLRLFNVFGTRSRTTGAYGAVMGVFLKQKLSNKPFTVVGDGKQTRDFVNVKDVADAFIKSAFSKKNNKIYNVGTGNPKSINYLTKLLKGKKIFIPKRPGEPFYSKANVKKIKKDLRWHPKVTFEDGVKDLVKNINYWKSAPLWNRNKIKKATKKWFQSLNKK
jgi:UDP-glucose 4-epimerase